MTMDEPTFQATLDDGTVASGSTFEEMCEAADAHITNRAEADPVGLPTIPDDQGAPMVDPPNEVMY